MLNDIGLVVRPEKSVVIPQQKIAFLGFVIDSVKMIVRLTEDDIQDKRDTAMYHT